MRNMNDILRQAQVMQKQADQTSGRVSGKDLRGK